jgi:hypothetical protein
VKQEKLDIHLQNESMFHGVTQGPAPSYEYHARNLIISTPFINTTSNQNNLPEA